MPALTAQLEGSLDMATLCQRSKIPPAAVRRRLHMLALLKRESVEVELEIDAWLYGMTAERREKLLASMRRKR